jgi:lactase-phlorizin hydrolase
LNARSPAGVVGISLNTDATFPLSASTEDENAAERELQFYFGWFAHPIFKNGDYPTVMIERVREQHLYSALCVPIFPQCDSVRLKKT